MATGRKHDSLALGAVAGPVLFTLGWLAFRRGGSLKSNGESKSTAHEDQAAVA